jgi:hypothetical protein
MAEAESSRDDRSGYGISNYRPSPGDPYQCSIPPTKQQVSAFWSRLEGDDKIQCEIALISLDEGMAMRLDPEALLPRIVKYYNTVLGQFERLNTEAATAKSARTAATGADTVQNPSLANTAQAPSTAKPPSNTAAQD